MGLVINTNVLALNAQRNLQTSQSSMATALQRLSSGLRINSAKDDAAGLAIAERFSTQIRGLNQAVRNANDGISLSQTAESALGELANNLQRIRELAVQSANSTNSASDRAALDLEVQQRISEVDRIASQTAFNGLKVLDGTFGTSQFQVGANAGETISINLSTGVRANQIGQVATGTGVAVNGSAITGTSAGLTINGVTIQASVAGPAGAAKGQTAASAYAKAVAINSSGVGGVSATANGATVTTTAFANGSNVVHNGDAAAQTYSLNVNGQDIYSGYSLAAGTGLTASTVASQVNLSSATTGVTASVNSSNHLVLTSMDGRDVIVTQGSSDTDVTSSILTAGGAAADAGAAGGDFTNRGTLTLSSSQAITISGTEDVNIGFDTVTAIALDAQSLLNTNVLTVSASNNAMSRVDAALTVVSNLRSQFGAIQGRFESTISNLQAVSENLTASRSRIQDADFAAETASLTRAQILQQAGIAILAQANAAPQSVLALLQ
jgi:flagellin